MQPPALLDPAQYRSIPWTNGGGVAVDILREGPFRLARTWIDTPGPFSLFPGQDRILAPIRGTGLVLERDDGPALDCARPFHPVAFPGEWPLRSVLPAGPVEVLNLFGERASCTISLDFSDATLPLSLAPGATILLHASTGPATLVLDDQPWSLASDQGLRLDPGGAASIRILSGRVAIATIRPLSPR